MKDKSRAAWGIGLLGFGLLFLVKKLNIVPAYVEELIFDYRNLPVAIGLILLFSQKNKSVGILLLIVGVLFYLKDIVLWTRSFSDFIWPLLLIGAGIVVLSTSRGKK